MTNLPVGAVLSEEDSIVLISMDQLASQSQPHTHCQPWEACDRIIPNLENQTRARFIQLKLTTAVKSKVIESSQYGCQRKTASPWGPCWRNRVFRRPLWGCQDSGCHHIHHPSTPNPAKMNSSQTDVRWGDEGCDTARLNAMQKMSALTTHCCGMSI